MSNKLKLRCCVCGGEHAARSDKFPAKITREVKDKEGKKINIIVGYVCLKSARKQIKKSRL